MILKGIQLFSDQYSNTMRKYKLALPFGLDFNMGSDNVKNILGEPNMDHPSGPDNTMYIWRNIKKLSIAVCCLPINKGTSFITIGPSKLRDL
jgi:hypothetical protein